MNPNNTQKQPLGQGLLGGITKKWEECNVEEKLEILRQEIRMSKYTNVTIHNLGKDIESLMQHEHGTDGKPVIKMLRNHGYGNDMPSSLDRLA